MMLNLGVLGNFPAHVAFEEKASRLNLSIDGISVTGDIAVELEIIISDGIHYCVGSVSCQATIECVRCLEPFSADLRGTVDFSIQMAGSRRIDPENVPDNEIIVEGNRAEVDISNPIREALILEVPIKPLCDEDCLGICPHCGINRNEKECNCKTETTDPRWDGLRNV